eukprot:TRINITY_DN5749_c0_g1_i5.p2 TRINITY_DN5749_c0_g1~~TRINITY_DN5749_c0_g1_i5.p2  ORF type:complete len:209 (+),score=52.03 TRINITY_DN5749_c0_g1_i5:80-706(+)
MTALKEEDASMVKVKEEKEATEDIDAHISSLQKEIARIEQEEKEHEVPERVKASVQANSETAHWQKKRETDSRSVFVGQIDYTVTAGELAALMGIAGVVNRVTLLSDKWTGYPKGSGYVEYENIAGATKALKLNHVPYKGRFLRVEQKRTNIPWFIASRYGGYDAVPFTQQGGRVAGVARPRLQARAWYQQTQGQYKYSPYTLTKIGT